MDGIQGLADLLAFGRPATDWRESLCTGTNYGRTQKQMALISRQSIRAVSTLLTNLGLWTVLCLSFRQ